MSCCVGMCCRQSSWLGVRCVVCYVTRDWFSPSSRSIRRTPNQLLSLKHFPTQHDMLPQHLVRKNELNCEYCNITLARNNKAPWRWSDKIETCRSDFKCFMWNLCKCSFWLIIEMLLGVQLARCASYATWRIPHHVAYDAHLTSCSLYNTFLHNMTCCHNTLFAKTN